MISIALMSKQRTQPDLLHAADAHILKPAIFKAFEP